MDVVNRSLPYDREASTSIADDIYMVDARLDDYRRDLRGLAAELDALRRFYRDTLQQLPVGVCGINTAGEVVLWNQTIERATRIAAEEIIGSTLDALPAPWRELLQAFLASGDAQQAPTRIDIDGQPRWISLQKAQPENDGTAGSVDARFLLVEDVTENQLLQDELFHSERLASIGRLAAGVAHEIGNPVTGVDCLAQNMLAETEDEDIRDGARQILRQTQRITSIVGTLVNFSHQGLRSDKAPEWMTLSACIDEAIYLLGLDRGATSVRYLNRVPGHLEVLGDAQKMVQVFVNLLSNARDASTADGLVEICTHEEHPDLVIEVRDEGCGIAGEHMDRVFEPFFTTKPAGRGTGLGLALVYSIVTEMGGSVVARSPANEGMQGGTRILIRLPGALANHPGTR
jgi:signal transduction histidine kinase